MLLIPFSLSPSDNHSTSMLVRKLDGIATLSDEERAAVLSLPTRTCTYGPGVDIVSVGDTPSQSCLVVAGWVCRHRRLAEGRRQILSIHIGGDFPDLQSLLMPEMDHNLGTMTATTVAFVPHEAIRVLMQRFPRISTAFWRETLIDAGISREWLIGMGQRSAHARVAHLLCETYVKLEAVGLAADHRCPLPITQAELADATGLSTVHVNRVLKQLRAQGLIMLRKGALVIRDWEDLTQAAEFNPTYLHLARTAAK